MVALMHAIFFNLSPLPANGAVIKTFITFLLTFTFFHITNKLCKNSETTKNEATVKQVKLNSRITPKK